MSAASDGLTTTTPRTEAPRSSAIRRQMQPPSDSPMRKISSVFPRSSSKVRCASASQSSERVRFISCHVVPCPGSLGTDTVSPASARYSAHGRSDAGVPVKP